MIVAYGMGDPGSSSPNWFGGLMGFSGGREPTEWEKANLDARSLDRIKRGAPPPSAIAAPTLPTIGGATGVVEWAKTHKMQAAGAVIGVGVVVAAAWQRFGKRRG